MIRIKNQEFRLETAHTAYWFHVTETGHLEHLYYGPMENAADEYRPAGGSEIDAADVEALSEKRTFPAGCAISLDQEHVSVTLEDLCLEQSGYGKGDVREPFSELVFADGSRTTDFRFLKAYCGKIDAAGKNDTAGINDAAGKNDTAGINDAAGKNDTAEINDAAGKDSPENEKDTSASIGQDEGENTANPEQINERLTLPHPYDETGDAERLTVVLAEQTKPVRLLLYYDVYPECDVICRSAALINDGEEPVIVERLMSAQVDFARDDFKMRSFHGAWAREMNPVDVPVLAGKYVVSSVCGISSNHANPFVMLYEEDASETSGCCFGFNLIYSGNHYEAAEVSAFGKTRFVSGINPAGFQWVLKPGCRFETPKAVMTVSADGFTGVSHAMHGFIRKHIVRGYWRDRVRPVLLNSWEANYFDISEKKLLKLAEKAKEAGIELFVMDDGWFGKRNDDTSSLGDWTENRRKLPGGLKQLAEKIRAMGMQFGIWVEPEMISRDSELCRAHPDWVMEIPGRTHSEGRNQCLLDLANPEVVQYMTEEMRRVFSSAPISYVKWDMNRIFSDVYSKAFPPEQQGEIAHRYICGFYRMAETLTNEFPEVLFEGCASGGNRFDPGMLCYFPQIWASDNTDALSRAAIQEGYSYGYPPSVLCNHVSGSPNHQTMRETPLQTRFDVAAFGILGYELNLVDLSDRKFSKIKAHIALYKQWRELLQFGTFYRSCGTGMDRKTQAHSRQRSWIIVSEDRKKAAALLQQDMVTPSAQFGILKARGLDPLTTYHFYNIPRDINLMRFGDLINTQAPVHIRQNSLAHRAIARYKRMPGEKEDYTVTGAALMSAGVKLLPAFSGNGYDDRTRYFQDYASRMYFMEAE